MKTVLVIEDDPWQADLVRIQLEKHCVVADIATDAIAGIEEIDKQLPSLIILDMFLPGPNGLTFLHELRSHQDTVNIPVIIWSADVTNQDLSKLKPYGVVEVIDKTTKKLDDLTDAVGKWLK